MRSGEERVCLCFNGRCLFFLDASRMYIWRGKRSHVTARDFRLMIKLEDGNVNVEPFPGYRDLYLLREISFKQM